MSEPLIQLSSLDLQGLAPALITASFGLIILMLDAFQSREGSRGYMAYFAVFGLVAAGLAAYVLWNLNVTKNIFSGMAYVDGFGQAITVIVVTSGALTCLMAMRFLKDHDADRGEFYALVLFSVTGMIVLASAADLIVIFLGLETVSISSYIMAGMFRRDKRSAEASLKYLILGALATGILLFGISFVYGTTGTTNLADIGTAFSGTTVSMPVGVQEVVTPDALAAGEFPRLVTEGGRGTLVPLAFIAMSLVVVGLSFKVAAVPFHMWVPDVYTGTPTPAVGFFATAVKTAGFAAVLRVLVTAFMEDAARNSATGWVQIVFVLCLASMLVGNVGAIVQNRVKRMLAYSSIAHAGYILIAVTASGYAPVQGGLQLLNRAVIFYLAAYTFATVGAFAVLAYLGRRKEEVTTYDDLNGLGFKYPWIGLAMIVFMFSAMGMPPTGGFIAKFLSFRTAIEVAAIGGPSPESMVWLAIFGILASVAGAYYYLRVLVHMYMRSPTRRIRALGGRATAFVIAVCAAATLYLGILPSRVTTLSNLSVARMADTSAGPRAEELPSEDEIEQARREAAGWTFVEGALDEE